jgi:hypothetical protein
MKVAIVGFEDFQNRKTPLRALQSALQAMSVELLIPCDGGGFETELKKIATGVGASVYEVPATKSGKTLHTIVKMADLCLAFTSSGFEPEGEGFRIVQKFCDSSKPVNVIQIGANGSARGIMKLRYYKLPNRVKSVSVMILTGAAGAPSKTEQRKSG